MKSLLDKLKEIEDRCYSFKGMTHEDVQAIREVRYLINRMCDLVSEE